MQDLKNLQIHNNLRNWTQVCHIVEIFEKEVLESFWQNRRADFKHFQRKNKKDIQNDIWLKKSTYCCLALVLKKKIIQRIGCNKNLQATFFHM